MPEWLSSHVMLTAGVAAALAVVCALLALKTRRIGRERDEFHDLLVANYEGCVTGLKEVLERRKTLCEGVAQRIQEVPQLKRAQAEMVSLRLVQGLRSIRESLLRQLNGENRLRLDFDIYREEMIACDEAMARLADLLVRSVSEEEYEKLKTDLGELRESSEREKSQLNARLSKLAREKDGIERRMSTMSDSEELARAKGLLAQIERDIDELEEGLLDESGQMLSGLDEEALQELEKKMEAIADQEAEAASEVETASDDLMRHGHGQRVRLKRLKRGVIDRVVKHSRAESQVKELTRKVEVLETVTGDDSRVLAEVEKVEAQSQRAREAMGASRQQLQALTQRLQQLENMEETSQRVRQELRNLGIINLDLQRQVEEMMHSQVLYERSLRSLSKLKAEVEERDERLRSAQGTIRQNEAEIRRLQALLDKYQSGNGPRSISVEPKRASISDAKTMRALESPDINLVRHALREKLEENALLRSNVTELQSEVTQKTSQITVLEGELDQLFNEYQKLFDRVPLS